MSDDEVVHSDDEGTGPTEAELAMQKRRAPISSEGMDEDGKALLATNKQARDVMEAEIQEMRAKSEQRKKERMEEEKQAEERRRAEETRRKGEEEEKRAKKDAEEMKRKEARASKMAEFEKWKNPSKPNFVIAKREDGGEGATEEGEEGGEGGEKKSREQLEAEKRAILAQRIQPLNIDSLDASKLGDKCKDLHGQLFRVECEKYDLEKRFKEQQYDMMELAERARQMVKVGRGGLKRVQLGQDEDVDKIQERFAGTPAKVVMYTKFERTVDARTYGDKNKFWSGPTFVFAASKVQSTKMVKWDPASGLPIYEFREGFTEPEEEEEAPEEE